MKFKKLFPLLAATAVMPLSACCGGDSYDGDPNLHTLNTYLAVCPSNWNELTYQDANDAEIMGYIGGGFFSFDFKFDNDGKIVPGAFDVKYDGITKAEDVTAQLGAQGKFGLTAEDKDSRAFKFTLRNDLKWDDGTPIKAKDFVYTMKQQLDPAYENYRADSYYVGSQMIHNAENYFKQGKIASFDNNDSGEIKGVDNLTKGANGVYNYNGQKARFAFGAPCSWNGGKKLTAYKAYLNQEAFAELEKKVDADGYIDITDETIELWGTMINTEDWAEEPENWISYVIYEKNMPLMDFSEVGFYAEGDYGLVIVLDNTLELFDEDGNLTYHAPYEFASLPLVKEDLFEKCRVPAAEGTEGALPTYNYNTSVETTASWGPYKLESFQANKQYVLVRNDNWYGYNKEENKGLYQTDRIVVDIIEKQATAWELFLAGDLSSIGISPAIGNVEYKTSSRAFFTGDDYVGSMQLQSNAQALKNRETAGYDKEILTYQDFRKAISLSLNRSEYTQKATTASLPGFGIFNDYHYYDVANGGVYRNTKFAKEVICDVYGVEYTAENLDAKYETVTGFDLAQAKELYQSAYDAAIADGKMNATDKVKLTFGTSALTETSQLQFDTICEMIKKGVEGTSLEGKIEFELKDFQEQWANDFRAGAYDICTGGWSGAAWNPGYFLAAYLLPSNMYSRSWDTSAQMLKFKPEGSTEEYEMSLTDWYACLNGSAGCAHNWAEGKADTDFRLSIIAALEKEVLKVYYTVPIYNYFSASLVYNKVEYITRDYNTFMGYGGIKYMTYNYNDGEWYKVKGDQDYKK